MIDEVNTMTHEQINQVIANTEDYKTKMQVYFLKKHMKDIFETHVGDFVRIVSHEMDEAENI